MKRSVYIVVFLIINQTFGQLITPETYIETWKETAINNMREHKIPASITLAQGLLESGNGNSRLAIKGNNHFGIKCHGWDGSAIYHDDDLKNECFRKYASAEESFKDHSVFLKKKRYEKLFLLEITDYKGWAKELKRAGYATNPKYPRLLIDLIERYNLSQYDVYTEPQLALNQQVVFTPKEESDNEEEETPSNLLKTEELDETTYVLGNKHLIKETDNRVLYIIARKGDNIESLCEEFDMRPWQFYKYNDLPKGSTISKGQRLFIKPKRWKARKEFHITKEGQTMHSISQQYGIKLKKLYKKNNMTFGSEPSVGQKLYLKRRKKS